MNAAEAAHYLGVPEATLQRWARQGLLGGGALNGTEYDAARLEAWANSRGIRRTPDAPAAIVPEESLLSAAVGRGAVRVAHDLKNASQAIEQALAALPLLSSPARAELLAAVLARELMAGTGIGRGIALPHSRKPPGELIREPTVSVLYVEPHLDWAALDGESVHTVFLVLAPKASVHLELLSRIAYSLRTPGFREELRLQPSQTALVDRLRLIKRVR